MVVAAGGKSFKSGLQFVVADGGSSGEATQFVKNLAIIVQRETLADALIVTWITMKQQEVPSDKFAEVIGALQGYLTDLGGPIITGKEVDAWVKAGP
jgi:hypothetical protein